MKVLTIGDRSLCYRDQGSGPAILWVHAFPLSGGMWNDQLAMEGIRHIVPDLPGFGESDPFPAEIEPSISAYAEDLINLLDHLDLESATLAGCSMGGYIVLELLRSAPARVAAAILSSTRETDDTPGARNARAEQIEKIESSGSLAALIDAMLPKLVTPEALNHDPIRQRLEAMMKGSSVPGVVFALGAMARRRDNADALRDLSRPVLILAGERDQLIPVEDAERMARIALSARLEIIASAGHLPAIEKAAEFNDSISNFIQETFLEG